MVDDEPAALKSLARALELVGFAVEAFEDPRAAAERCLQIRFDAIVCDVLMPKLDGLEFLRSVREHDPDVPVVLVTGSPAIEGAIKAMELRAFRYLRKPIAVDTVRDAVRLAVNARAAAQSEHDDLMAIDSSRPVPDRAGLELRFSNALCSLWMAFQPIVSWSDRSVFAHEALVRNEEPSLRSPLDLFDAAESLGALQRLGRIVRRRVADALARPDAPPTVFVNAHPADLEDPDLFAADAPLSHHAARIVLEITERAALDRIDGLAQRIERLRRLGYRIALDDLGAGYAGLASFAHLEPEIVKVDMSLIRGVDSSPTKQKLLASLVSLCHDLDKRVVAEGIETEAERATFVRLGGDLCQGYFFSRPGRPFPVPALAPRLPEP